MKTKSPSEIRDVVRVTIKVPSGAEGAAGLARLFRRVREAAILDDCQLTEWITRAIRERRERLVASGKWEGGSGKGSQAERAAGCQGGDHRGGTGKGGRS